MKILNQQTQMKSFFKKQECQNIRVKQLKEQPYMANMQSELTMPMQTNKTHQWLKNSGLKVETEAFITAAQDQSLFTRNYQVNIIKNCTYLICRLCEQHIETTDYLVPSCPILTPKRYKECHASLGSIFTDREVSITVQHLLKMV